MNPFISVYRSTTAWENQQATLFCDLDYRIYITSVLFVDGFRRPTCGDPTALQALQAECQKLQICNPLIDRSLFVNSTCPDTTTHRFYVAFQCRFGTYNLQFSKC